jgi:hypothetical protein
MFLQVLFEDFDFKLLASLIIGLNQSFPSPTNMLDSTLWEVEEPNFSSFKQRIYLSSQTSELSFS